MWYIIKDCIEHPQKYKDVVVNPNDDLVTMVTHAGAIGSSIVVRQ